MCKPPAGCPTDIQSHACHVLLRSNDPYWEICADKDTNVLASSKTAEESNLSVLEDCAPGTGLPCFDAGKGTIVYALGNNNGGLIPADFKILAPASYDPKENPKCYINYVQAYHESEVVTTKPNNNVVVKVELIDPLA